MKKAGHRLFCNSPCPVFSFIQTIIQTMLCLPADSRAGFESVQTFAIQLTVCLFIQVYGSAHDVIRADAGGIDGIPGGGGGMAHAVTIVYDLIQMDRIGTVVVFDIIRFWREKVIMAFIVVLRKFTELLRRVGFRGCGRGLFP